MKGGLEDGGREGAESSNRCRLKVCTLCDK